MLMAVAAVTGLAWWDEQREDDAALLDLETEQSTLASSFASALRARLTAAEHAAVLLGEFGVAPEAGSYSPRAVRPEGAPRTASPDKARLLVSIPVSEHRVVDLGVPLQDLVETEPGRGPRSDLQVLVQDPRDSTLHSSDGRAVSSVALLDALRGGARTLRLTRPQAAEVGLPARTSVAGIAHVDAGPLGRFGLVTAASAARERDRERRAQRRLALSVFLASGLVLAFGGAALRRQRKEMELARELSLAELQRQGDADLQRAARAATMGTFAMGIAHEVSTPLGIIVGRAEQLLSGGTERNAHAILKQAVRIQHIVRRFLDMARGGPPVLERADPTGIVRAATTSVEHRFAKARVSLTVDVPPVLPAIQCDQDLLEQAIVNLLLNACEACVAGGRVEVTARSDAQDVAFVVNDDGPGISAENAARATEPFFTTKGGGGSGAGLGLAIATEIAKSHRGRLSIGPRGGVRGTRACIEIPIGGG
jgi:signal transduction histidine kinase